MKKNMLKVLLLSTSALMFASSEVSADSLAGTGDLAQEAREAAVEALGFSKEVTKSAQTILDLMTLLKDIASKNPEIKAVVDRLEEQVLGLLFGSVSQAREAAQALRAAAPGALKAVQAADSLVKEIQTNAMNIWKSLQAVKGAVQAVTDGKQPAPKPAPKKKK